jgi:hypothetical protein
MLTNVSSIFSCRTCQCSVMYCFLVAYLLWAHLYFYSRQHSDGIVHLFKHLIIEHRFISVFWPQIQINIRCIWKIQYLTILATGAFSYKNRDTLHFTALHCPSGVSWMSLTQWLTLHSSLWLYDFTCIDS